MRWSIVEQHCTSLQSKAKTKRGRGKGRRGSEELLSVGLFETFEDFHRFVFGGQLEGIGSLLSVARRNGEILRTDPSSER